MMLLGERHDGVNDFHGVFMQQCLLGRVGKTHDLSVALEIL